MSEKTGLPVFSSAVSRDGNAGTEKNKYFGTEHIDTESDSGYILFGTETIIAAIPYP